MRSMVLRLSLAPLAFVVLISACPAPAPQSSTTVDASDAATVCAHLAAIGCAQPATCATVIATRQGTFTDFKIPCLLMASTPASAQACGTVQCSTTP